MSSSTVQKSSLQFLRDLSKNNNKPWFAEHKARYTECHENMIAFAEVFQAEMAKYDLLEPQTGKKVLYRIYRDVRFSKDKTPYKSHFAGSFKRATAALRGGYFFSVQPGATFIGGGFWNPNSPDLARIRHEIAHDADSFRTILNDPQLVKSFGHIQGDKVKTSPKGYSKDHEAIDLLRHKSFHFGKQYSDKDVLSDDFVQRATQDFLLLRPWFDLMSDVLTTDVNGVSLLDT